MQIRHTILVLLLSMLTVSGCSTLKTPRTFASLGQFEQFQLNDDVYRVTYVANGYTRQQDAEEIALLHAAKVTLQHGYRYFQMINDPSSGTYVPPPLPISAFDIYMGGPMYYQRGVFYRGNTAYDRFYGGYYRDWGFPDRIQISYTIRCRKTQEASQTAFDAQKILQSLGQKYALNADGSDQVVTPIPTAPKAAQ